MRTIEINLYKFDELSQEAKDTALFDNMDINFTGDWWDTLYEDAKTIGLKITSFNVDTASYCNAEFIDGDTDTANKIIAEHGEQTETCKLAKQFLKDYSSLVECYSDGVHKNQVAENNESYFDEDADDLGKYFLKGLRDEYKTLLTKEYEYLSSREAVQEALEANEYEFTIDGKIY